MANPSKPVAGEASLIPLGSHAEAAPIVIKRPVTLIGSRQEAVRLHLASSSVSKVHCVIILNSWGCYIHDLGSRTKTWVNGQEVVDANLEDGDLIQVGRFKFRYVAPPGATGVPTPAPAAELNVSTLTDPLPLVKRVLQIGRRVGSDLQFDDRDVSNVHAILFEHNGARYARDLSSRTGTWLDGKPIHQEALDDGAVLKVGPATLTIAETAADVADAGDLDLDLDPPQIAAQVVAGAAAASLAIPLDFEDDVQASEETAVGTETPVVSGHDVIDLVEEPPAAAPPIELEVETEADDKIAEDADALADLRRGWRATPHEEDPAEAPLALAPPTAEIAPIETPAAKAPEPTLQPLTEAVAAERSAEAPVPIVEPAIEEPAIADLAEAKDGRDEGDDDLLIDLAPAAANADSIELAEDEIPAAPTEDLSAEIELSPIAEELEINDEVAKASAADEPMVIADLTEPVELDDEEEDEELAIFLDTSPLAETLNAAPPEPTVPAAAAEASAVVDDAAEDELSETTVVEPVAEEDDELAVSPEEQSPASALAQPPVETNAVAEAATAEEQQEDPQTDAAFPAAPSDEAASESPAVIVNEADAASGLEAAAEAHAEVVADLPAAPIVEVPAATDDAVDDVEEIEPAATDELAAEAPVSEAPAAGKGWPGTTPEAVAEEKADPQSPLAAEDDAAMESWVDGNEAATFATEIEKTEFPAATDVTAAAESFVEPPAKAAADAVEADEEELDDESAQLRAAGVTHPPAPAADDFAIVDDVKVDDEIVDETGEAEDNSTPSLEVMGSSESASVVRDTGSVDLSAAQFDAEVVDSEETEESANPTPVRIDFSHLQLHSPDDEAPTEETPDIDLDALETIEEASVIDDTTPLVPTAETPVTDGESDEIFDAILDDLAGDDDKAAADAAEALAHGAEPDRDDSGEDEENRPTGDLSDLIPEHPPLMGGAFLPEPQQFMVGGSPIVNMNQPLPPQAPAARSESEKEIEKEAEKRRPRRVGFGGNCVSRPSPFASGNGVENRAASDVLIGRRGVPSVDVFSNPSPTAEEILLDHAAEPTPDSAPTSAAESAAATPLVSPADPHAKEHQEMLQTADRFRPRGAIRPPADAALGSPNPQAQPAGPSDHEHQLTQAELRRKRIRRVMGLTLAMLPLIGAGVWGVQKYTPVFANVDALITFQNLDSLSKSAREDFRQNQNDVVQNDVVRQDAIRLLPADVKPGFLGNITQLAESLDRNPGVRWPEERSNLLRLRVRSHDLPGDTERLRSLARAVLKANEDKVAKANKLKDELQNDQARVQGLNIQISALNDDLQALQQVGETAPDGKTLDVLAGRIKAAETERTGIVARRQDLEVEIARLQQAAPTATPVPESELLKNDKELADLTAKAADLDKQIEANRRETGQRSSKARKEMDDQIALLQQQLDTAQKLGKNPELEIYIDSARKIFDQVRQMTDGMIRRQEQFNNQLVELKKQLADEAEAHARESLIRDPELKKLKDRFAILSRMANAGNAEGREAEVAKLQLEIRTVDALIKARETLLTDDTVSTKTAARIQDVIDTIQRNLQSDRKEIDTALTQAQERFLKNAPAVEKLPAEQRLAAAEFEEKLKKVTEARRAFTKASEKAEAEQAAIEAEQKQRAGELQLAIRARKQVAEAAVREQLAKLDGAERQKRIDAKNVELTALLKQEKSADALLQQVNDERDKAQNHRKRLLASQDDVLRKSEAKAELDRQVTKLNAAIRLKQIEFGSLIVPEGRFDIQAGEISDNRPMYAMIAAGSIFLLLLIPIVWTLRLISRDSHLPPLLAPLVPANGFEPVLPREAAQKEASQEDEMPIEEEEPVASR